MTAAVTDYITTVELARFINVENKIPSNKEVGSRTKELVGTGDNSTVLWYLAHGNVLASSYTIYAGASESAATALTETTDYIIDKDDGSITLTTAGKTTVGTNKIYAKYSYCSIDLSDTQLQETIDRAQNYIEEHTESRWVDGAGTTPNWGVRTNDKDVGKGKYDRDYWVTYGPIASFTTLLNGAVAASATSITVDSTASFPSSGIIGIDGDKIAYTGKTGTTFTGCSGIDNAHLDNATVYPFAVEISTTDSGTEPAWKVLTYGSEYDINPESGKVHLYKTDYDLTYYALQYPPRMVPNRFRISYLYGWDTIDNGIKELTLRICARELMQSTISRSLTNGFVDFKPDLYKVHDSWIDDQIVHHRFFVSSIW